MKELVMRMSPEALRAERKRRMAARAAATAQLYDPARKPSHLGGAQPGVGYHWYGRLPDDGSAYGLYRTTASTGIISTLPSGGRKVIDPKSGKPARFIGPAPKSAVRAVRAAASKMHAMPNCPACGARNLVTSDAIDETAPLHCPECGSELKKAEAPSVAPAADVGPAAAPLQYESPEAEENEGGEAEKPESEEHEGGEAEKPESEEHESEEHEGGEAVEKEEKKDATAVKYEALAGLDVFDSVPVAPQDVEMSLHDADTADPFWNLTVKGQPIGRIHLQDQPKPTEARAVFVNANTYPRGVAHGIAAGGLRKTAERLKVRLWANQVQQSRLAKQIRREVTAGAKASLAREVEALKEKFLKNVALATAALDRNLYPEIKTPRKAALFSAFRRALPGVPAEIVMAAIEEGCRAGDPEHQKLIMSLATEYMDMPEPIRARLEALTGQIHAMPQIAEPHSVAAHAMPTGMATPAQADTLSQRLALASVSYTGSQEPMSPGDLKQQFASVLAGLSPRRG